MTICIHVANMSMIIQGSVDVVIACYNCYCRGTFPTNVSGKDTVNRRAFGETVLKRFIQGRGHPIDGDWWIESDEATKLPRLFCRNSVVFGILSSSAGTATWTKKRVRVLLSRAPLNIWVGLASAQV